MYTLATGVFPTGAGTDIVDAVTGAISDNITEILVVLGFVVGLKIALKLFNGSLKGKARV